MDIKEIREWVRITEGEEQARNGGYYYSRYIKGRVEQIKFLLSEVERLEKENKKLQDSLYKNSRISDYTLLEERCAKLEKENAALREVAEAAKKAWNKFSDNGESLPCAGGHFVSGNMTINDMLLIGEAIEKIKDVETEDEHQERINGLSRNGDE